MTVYATVPPTATDEIFKTGCAMQVYVPAKSLKAYKTAEGWKNLKLNALEANSKSIHRNVGFSVY